MGANLRPPDPASGSLGRRETAEALQGYEFEVEPSNIPEADGSPARRLTATYGPRLAWLKAEARWPATCQTGLVSRPTRWMDDGGWVVGQADDEAETPSRNNSSRSRARSTNSGRRLTVGAAGRLAVTCAVEAEPGADEGTTDAETTQYEELEVGGAAPGATRPAAGRPDLTVEGGLGE